MPKEYQLMSVIGFFVIGYLLDAVVDPIALPLETPYHFFTPEMLSEVPFSTASILFKSVGLLLTPVVIFSFFKGHYLGKAALVLVMSSLLQLYALQDISAKKPLVSQEWAIGFTGAGLLLLIPFVFYMFKGLFSSLRENVTTAKLQEEIKLKSQERQSEN